MNMNRCKKWLGLVLLVPLIFWLTACSQGGQGPVDESSAADASASESQEVEESATIEVVDSVGRIVELDGPAESVVTEQPSHAEIVYALDQEDAIVGRGSYVDYPQEVTDIPDVGSGTELNVEAIVDLDPDVVFLDTMGDRDQEHQQLEEAGITVVVVHAETLDQVYETIDLIGTVMGAEEEAVDLVDQMQTTFAEYSERADQEVADGQTASIYYEVSPLEYGLWTAGSNTFMDEIGQLLNMDNIFADVDGFGEVSEEQVLTRDPAYIVTTTMEAEGFDPVEEILQRPGWDQVTAVAQDQVYMAQSDEFTRPGPRLMDAIDTLFHLIYGQESADEADLDQAA